MAKLDDVRIGMLNVAMVKAIEAGKAESMTAETHWYPCGFAWLAYRCRKNSKIGKALQAMGWRWSDYEKAWQTSLYDVIPAISGMSQSMDYRARILAKVRDVLKAEGFTEFYVETRID